MPTEHRHRHPRPTTHTPHTQYHAPPCPAKGTLEPRPLTKITSFNGHGPRLKRITRHVQMNATAYTTPVMNAHTPYTWAENSREITR